MLIRLSGNYRIQNQECKGPFATMPYKFKTWFLIFSVDSLWMYKLCIACQNNVVILREHYKHSMKRSL